MNDPRMSFCIETSGPPSQHVEIDGTAEALTLPDFDIWPVSRKLAEKYVGPGRSGQRRRCGCFFHQHADRAADAVQGDAGGLAGD